MYTISYFKQNRRFKKSFKNLDDLYRFSMKQSLYQFFIEELVSNKSEYRIYIGD